MSGDPFGSDRQDSKSKRVTHYFAIDTGYATGSLALVADSFHMLNDVMSLLVALYAVKASAADHSSLWGIC